MINQEHTQQLVGRDLLDRDGHRIGQITQVYVDDRTGEPAWVTVKSGWFGLSESFVPLNRVQWSGDQLLAGYDTATIKDAPRFAVDEPLTAQNEDTLYAHYGLSETGLSDTGPGDAPVPNGATTERAGPVTPGSRGRLRRDDAHTRPAAVGPNDRGGAAVCQQCGAYIAADLQEVHDTFHGSVARPPSSYARHDIEVTEPPTGLTRPPVDHHARHDIEVTEPPTGLTRPPVDHHARRDTDIG